MRTFIGQDFEMKSINVTNKVFIAAQLFSAGWTLILFGWILFFNEPVDRL